MSKYALVKAEDAYILSTESATAQLMDLLSYYDINLGLVEDEMARKQLERQLDQIVDYIRRGKVEVRRTKDEKIEVVHHTEKKSELVYAEVNAAAKQAMDRHPVEARYGRLYAFMGALSGVGHEGIVLLGAKDLAIVDLLGSVFQAA